MQTGMFINKLNEVFKQQLKKDESLDPYQEGIKLAEEQITSQRAYKKLKELIKLSNKLYRLRFLAPKCPFF
ncbi:MAG: hypothetical protein U9Q08_04335 [Candidatus Omnitrophota bacterium]|nr:hypothetical protein [Candidatus Omnitrophota bacterium]